VFVNEQELVDSLLTFDTEIHGCTICDGDYLTEFNYSSGRTDILLLSYNGEVIALEAKLYKWRVALRQAYRNSGFCDRSYVVLPMNIALKAAEYSKEFEDFGIGIMGISRSTLEIIKDAPKNKPIQPALKAKAIQKIKGVNA